MAITMLIRVLERWLVEPVTGMALFMAMYAQRVEVRE